MNKKMAMMMTATKKISTGNKTNSKFLFLVSAILVVLLASYTTVALTQSSRPSPASTSTSSSTSSHHVVWGISSTTTTCSGPATIEKETVRTPGGGPAVLDRPSTVQKERVDNPVRERSREGGEAWEVRIYNDGMNTREHVARSLVQITGMTEMTAYQTMMQAHQNGIAAVGRFCFEVAEMYNDGLRKQGIISDIIPVDEES